MLNPATAFRKALLAWYDAHARSLPWRAAVGAPRTEPYRVWLSEVMLQQTQVDRVLPKYAEFLVAFPTVQALAAAAAGDVLRAWAGLGYNLRAMRLHQTAQDVAANHGGVFPDTVEGLLADHEEAPAAANPIGNLENGLRQVFAVVAGQAQPLTASNVLARIAARIGSHLGVA